MYRVGNNDTARNLKRAYQFPRGGYLIALAVSLKPRKGYLQFRKVRADNVQGAAARIHLSGRTHRFAVK